MYKRFEWTEVRVEVNTFDYIFDDPAVSAYFREWGPIERLGKTKSDPTSVGCTELAKEVFKKNIENCTDLEEVVLGWCVQYLLKRTRPTFAKYADWKFIKINSSMEFGYPFTLGKYIFMPNDKLENAVKAIQNLKCIEYSQFEVAVNRAVHSPWKSNKWDMCLKLLTYLCAHEQIHIHQRYNPDLYMGLLKSIGFIPVPKTKIVLDPWTLKHRVTNPDGVRGLMWLTEISGKWYMPMMVMTSPRSKPKSVLIHMVKTREGNWSPIVYLGKVVYQYPINSIPEYVNRFYLANGLYDPNEIVAYIAADLVMNHKIENTVFNKKIMDFVQTNVYLNTN